MDFWCSRVHFTSFRNSFNIFVHKSKGITFFIISRTLEHEFFPRFIYVCSFCLYIIFARCKRYIGSSFVKIPSSEKLYYRIIQFSVLIFVMLSLYRLWFFDLCSLFVDLFKHKRVSVSSSCWDATVQWDSISQFSIFSAPLNARPHVNKKLKKSEK